MRSSVEPGEADGREHDRRSDAHEHRPTAPDAPAFVSLLAERVADDADAGEPLDPGCAFDLRLDQVVEAIVRGHEESDYLRTLLYRPVAELDAIRYRQEVFSDLEDERLLAGAAKFAEQMREVREHLSAIEKMHHPLQRQGWFLDAAAIYCHALRSLAETLDAAPVRSRAMTAFRAFLSGYLASEQFTTLEADTSARKQRLGQIVYDVRIRGSHVDVSRYDDEPDYSVEVEALFERFAQGEVRDYRRGYRGEPGFNHVTAQILELVARLFPEPFAELAAYCEVHRQFLDETVRRFERELDFYLSYLAFAAPLRSTGLRLCLPEVSDSKQVNAVDTFDLALANKLVGEGKPVVVNDFHLSGPERIIVVSGPNQGGKTTFARTFGQLHHLAALGCPVPGSSASLFLCDRIYTHFEREEDLGDLRGKLESDLVRIDQLLRVATARSIVILNEIFTSTTIDDARFLGEKVMAKLIELDLLGVFVTFIDELASAGEQVVSMLSKVVPEDPAQRTFKVQRAPADGLAYALAVAAKHNVTYERLQARLTRGSTR
ncbi:MAG TPA: hypothetical protein VFW09_12610 [Solirubrobacteraceae bacterium]|nr:hypothetical protein [Solirubrobacteraceae bacterium]